jgi:hypothetical protein
MTVNPILPVSVSIAASANPVCAGTSVTFTATPVNGGTTPAYQWFKNSVAIATGATYTYVPVNGDAIYVVLTSNATCATGNPATSNTITMTVNPILPVSVSIAASANPVCEGTSVTFTATPINGGTIPLYQWYMNNSAVATGSNFTYVPANGDAIYVVMTSNATCATGNPATSNTITMAVNPNLPVSVSIAASANPVCAGTSVTFTATPTNGGTAPAYQWFKNTVAVGTGATYTYVPVNGDVIYVVLTSNAAPCATGSPATSNTVTMTVYPIPPAPVVTNTGYTAYSSAPAGNQWYYSATQSGTGAPIPGATAQTYYAVPTGTGWYWSIVTLNGCSSDTSNHKLIITVGIDSHSSTAINIYPVPNDGRFNVSITTASRESFSISVYNGLGVKIYEETKVDVNGSLQKVIDLRPVPSGVYSVIFVNSENQVVKRIIVNK